MFSSFLRQSLTNRFKTGGTKVSLANCVVLLAGVGSAVTVTFYSSEVHNSLFPIAKDIRESSQWIPSLNKSFYDIEHTVCGQSVSFEPDSPSLIAHLLGFLAPSVVRCFPTEPLEEDLVHYFAYSTNMREDRLSSRGVPVIRSTPAIMHGVRLIFNITNDSVVEPSFANLAPFTPPIPDKSSSPKQNAKGARPTSENTSLSATTMEVHGVVHDISRDALFRINELNSAYVLKEATVQTYTGDKLKCLVHIATKSNNPDDPALIELPPSSRYLYEILKAAAFSGLRYEYLEYLQNLPTHTLPKLKITSEQYNQINQRIFTRQDLRKVTREGHLVWAFKDVVFDVSTLSYPEPMKKKYSGEDVTMFIAKYLRGSPELVEHLTEDHKTYINATLMDFLKKAPILGRYQSQMSITSPNAKRTKDDKTTYTLGEHSWPSKYTF